MAYRLPGHRTTAETGSGTDAGYAYDPETGTPAVLESLGHAGGRYHSDEEFVELSSVVLRLYLATRLIMELSRGDTSRP